MVRTALAIKTMTKTLSTIMNQKNFTKAERERNGKMMAMNFVPAIVKAMLRLMRNRANGKQANIGREDEENCDNITCLVIFKYRFSWAVFSN